MALPTPTSTAWPTPQPGFAAPQPGFTFGLTEADQELQAAVPTLAPVPFAIATGSVAAPSLESQASSWNPEEAAAQTDRALARIAQVNPELAQNIAAQREGGEVQEEGGNFLSDIWNGAKEGFFGVIDLLDRASHIVPEMLYDTDEAWYKNIGDALSGNSDIRWRDVLEDKWGMEESWFTQVAGFVGDVATDPLTYVTFGMGGVGRQAVGRTAQELTVKAFLTGGDEAGAILLRDAVLKGGDELAAFAAKEGIDEATAVTRVLMEGTNVGRELAEKTANSAMARMRKAVGWAAPENQDGLWFQMFEQTESAALRQALQLGDNAFKAATTQNWWTVSKEMAAELGIDKAAVDAAAKQLIKSGSGFGVSRSAYMAGRNASALLGGVRLRMPMPILGFRFQTGRLLPMSQHLSFQRASRFFAGMGAAKKLGHMVGKKTATVADWNHYMAGGLNGRFVGPKDNLQWVPGLRHTNPELASRLTGGRNILGSVTYPFSEMVGSVTARFSPSSAVVRGGGWGVKQAADARRQAQHAIEGLDSQIRTITDENGQMIPPAQADAIRIKGWGNLQDAEARTDIVEAVRTFGINQPWYSTADGYFNPLIEQAQQNGQLDLAQRLAAQRDAQKAVWARIEARGADFATATRHHVQEQLNAREVTVNWGDPDVLNRTAAEVDELRPGATGMDQLLEGNHPLVAEANLVPDGELDGPLADAVRPQGRSKVNVVNAAHFVIRTGGEEVEEAPELVTPNELDELLRDIGDGGGAVEGMFAGMEPDPLSLGARLRRRVPDKGARYMAGRSMREVMDEALPRGASGGLSNLKEDMTVQDLLDWLSLPSGFSEPEDLGGGIKRIIGPSYGGGADEATHLYYVQGDNGIDVALSAQMLGDEPTNITFSSRKGLSGEPGMDLLRALRKETGAGPNEIADIINKEALTRKGAAATHKLLKEAVEEADNMTFDDLVRDLTDDEIRVVREKLDLLRRDKAALLAKQAEPPRPLRIDQTGTAIPHEQGYLYHTTTEANLEDMRERGVELREGPFAELAEGTDARVYAGRRPDKLPKGEVIVRFKEKAGNWTDVGEKDWVWSGNPVKATEVEVLTEDGWQVLKREDVGQGVSVLTTKDTDALIGRRGSSRYGAQARNPYVRDQRTKQGSTPATSQVDELAEIERQADEFLEAGKKQSLERLHEADIREEILARMDPVLRNIMEHDGVRDKAEIIEKWLRATGRDSLITLKDDGTYVSILRREDKLLPVAQLNPRAPHVGVETLNPPMAATQDALTAVNRMPRVRQLPGGSRHWLDNQIRDVAFLPHSDAERELRRRLEAIGVRLKPNQNVLETDTYKVERQAARRTARTAAQRQLGYAFRKLESMGYADSVWRGTGISQSAPYEFVVNGGEFEAYDRYMGQLERADKRAARWQAEGGVVEMLARARRMENQLTQRLADYQSRIVGIINEKKLTSSGSVWEPEEIRAFLDDMQVTFEQLRAIARGEVSPDNAPYGAQLYEELSENMHRWTEVTQHQGRTYSTDHYVWVEDDKVVGVRSVDGHDSGDPTRASVTAYVDPDYQGQGIGGVLHEQDWYDRGILGNLDPDDDFENAARAIGAQSLSDSGIALNEKQLKKLTARIKQQLEEETAEAVRDLENRASQAQLDMNEVNRLVTSLKHRSAPVRPAMVPAENARNMTGYQTVRFPGQAEVAMPVFMAQEFLQAMDGFRSLSGFHKEWRRFNGWWKSMATWLWPGFHIRNMVGAFFNNSIGGVGFKSYVAAGRVQRAMHEMAKEPSEAWRWAKTKVKAKDPRIIAGMRRAGIKNFGGVALDELTYADLANMMTSMGVGSGNGRSFAEAELVAEAAEFRARGGTALERRVPPLRGYKKMARGAGTMTENTFRFSAFLHGLETYGDLNEARAFTMVRHGDYTDLTDMEYTWIRDLIPFYKWMRTNTPFQVHQLLENPGALLAVYKAQETAFGLAGRDYREEKYRIPKWMQAQFLVPFGDDEEAYNAIGLDLPMSDLAINGREFFSSFLPLVRPLLESYIYEKSTFSGAPIEGDMVRLHDVFTPIGAVLEPLGVTRRGEDGGYYIRDKEQNIVGMVPFFSRFRNWVYEDPDRAKLRANTVASSFFGIGLRPIDDEQLVDTELDFYYTRVLPEIDRLKQMGYPVPTTDDIQAAGQMTDTVLAGLGITPNTALVA